MPDYDAMAPFYDEIMGDRGPETDRVARYIAAHRPGAASLLELGCGTGALLSGLAGQQGGLSLTGIDRSAEMLAVAARTVPGADLIQGDITAFRLPGRFDVVICMFDTLNHVTTLAGWHALFARAHEHLAPGGLFIFDVNTTGRLARLAWAPPYVADLEAGTVIMTIAPARGHRARSDAGPVSLVRWETRIFQHTGGDRYQLHREQICELAVPLAQIRAALARGFEVTRAESLDGSEVSDAADRVFFACRRRD